MSGNPIGDALARDWHAAEDAMRHLMHPHAATQTPAAEPVNLAAAAAAAPPEGKQPVSLSTIAADIKTAAENADSWVKEVTETHLPAILAVAQRYENDPIVQALEGALLPPEVTSGIVAMITDLKAKFPAPAAVDPAAPVAASAAPVQ